MRNKDEINKLLTNGFGLNPEARKILEAELAIIIDREAKEERAEGRKKESKRFWIATAIAISSSIIAIGALIVAIVK